MKITSQNYWKILTVPFAIGYFSIAGVVESQTQVKVELMDRIPLNPRPQQIDYQKEKIPFPQEISIPGLTRPGAMRNRSVACLLQLCERLPQVTWDWGARFAFQIRFQRSEAIQSTEGYSLQIDPRGIQIISRTASGEFYALQTLYQLLNYSYYGTEMLHPWFTPAETDAREKHYLPLMKIQDWPQYAVRALMLDLGRATFPKIYLKRIIRVMAQLKLNWLHLHLYDDELAGFRFADLPIGHENPYALSAADLRELVQYARSFQITVMPELEAWGHVQSLIYHFPELYGAPGMYGGASLAIGEKSYALLTKMFAEIIPCLENFAPFHVGMDEAIWAVAPGEESKGHTPTSHVQRVYGILTQLGQQYQKQIQMHLWADHGGRPLPAELQSNVVLQPWKYRRLDSARIIQDLTHYGGAGKTPIMMGAGITCACYEGDFGATRAWCQQGMNHPNISGGTICLWGTNDLAGRLITVFAGAHYLWNPTWPPEKSNDPFDEVLRTEFQERMRRWQIIFPDADPAALNADRGPEVFLGNYVWPPLTGKPVAPTREYIPPGRQN